MLMSSCCQDDLRSKISLPAALKDAPTRCTVAYYFAVQAIQEHFGQWHNKCSPTELPSLSGARRSVVHKATAGAQVVNSGSSATRRVGGFLSHMSTAHLDVGTFAPTRNYTRHYEYSVEAVDPTEHIFGTGLVMDLRKHKVDARRHDTTVTESSQSFS